MNPALAALTQLPARSVSSILQQLLQIRRRSNAGEDATNPFVTLFLRAGQSLSGWVLDVAVDKDREVVLLHLSEADPRQPHCSVLYMDSSEIVGLAAHDAEGVLQELSFGRLKFPPGAPAPTKLEVNRRIASVVEKLQPGIGRLIVIEPDWNGLPTSDEGIFRVFDSVKALSAVLLQIASDDLGRDALKQSPERIRLIAGGAAKCRWDGKVFILEVGPKDSVSATDISETLKSGL